MDGRRMLLGMLTSYGLVRLTSYVTSPRPYLWWHGALDATVIVLMWLFCCGTLYLLAARDVLGFWLKYPVAVWRSTPTVYRIALTARRRERGEAC